MSIIDFLRWVAARRAHDNPRGSFIRDTRDLLEVYDTASNPDHILSYIESRASEACIEAKAEGYRLERRWKKELGLPHGRYNTWWFFRPI